VVTATYISKPFSESTIPLLVFVATGLTMAAVTETLRQAIERLAKAKAYTETLLEELRHRTKNNLLKYSDLLIEGFAPSRYASHATTYR
jgi:hypothetical protein